MAEQTVLSLNPEPPSPGFLGRRLRSIDYMVVFCVALAARMIHIIGLQNSPIFFYKIGDAARYDAWAKSLASGNWIGEGVFYQAPLYPYFLGVVYRWMGDDILTVRRVQALLGALACLMLMRATANLFGRRSGIIAGLMLALYGPSIFLEGLIQKSVLDLFFLTALLWMFTESLRSRRPILWLGIGLATGALCLTRENALVVIPIAITWLTLGRLNRRGVKSSEPRLQRLPAVSAHPRLIGLVMFGLGLLLTLGPVSLRNHAVGGQWHLTTSQLGPNFYIGNNPGANGSYRPLLPGRGDAKYEQSDAVELAEKELGPDLTPREVSRFYLQKSMKFIQNEPLSWLTLMGRKLLLTINSSEILDTEDQYTVARWSPILWGTGYFHFGILLPLGSFGLMVTRRRWRSLWFVYAVAAAFALTVVVFFVFGRYRFPLVPIAILFAAPGSVRLWKWIRSGFRKLKLMHLLCLIGVLIVCHLPMVDSSTGRGVTLSNYGVQALIRSDFEHADQFLQEALVATPKSPLVHNNLAILYRETERFDLARHHLEIGLRLEPEDHLIRRNLECLASVEE